MNLERHLPASGALRSGTVKFFDLDDIAMKINDRPMALRAQKALRLCTPFIFSASRRCMCTSFFFYFFC